VHPAIGRGVALVRTVYAVGRERDVTFLAAAVAYYAFVSLVPLTLLGFAVASLVGSDALTGGARQALGGLLAPEGEALLVESLSGETGRGGASVLGTLVLLWSGSRVLRGLDRAFSRVYGVEDPESLPAQLRDAALVLGVTLVGLAGMALVTALVALVPVLSVLRGVGVVTLWVTLVVAFLPLYSILPDAGVAPREALPGAAVAATAFVALGSLFGAYTAVAGGFSLYGVLGVVLLVVTWLFFGATAVMYGAVFNAVLSGHAGGERATGG
jgi:membrane protein